MLVKNSVPEEAVSIYEFDTDKVYLIGLDDKSFIDVETMIRFANGLVEEFKTYGIKVIVVPSKHIAIHKDPQAVYEINDEANVSHDAKTDK